jgi:hypothetical protein
MHYQPGDDISAPARQAGENQRRAQQPEYQSQDDSQQVAH